MKAQAGSVSAESLHLGSGGYGLLVACLGIGAVPGALLAARPAGKDRGRRVTLTPLGVLRDHDRDDRAGRVLLAPAAPGCPGRLFTRRPRS
jgi:hypothetical protein